MRLGYKSKNEFFLKLNRKFENIQNNFLKEVSDGTKAKKLKVMLGDGTVSDISTFDPKNIEKLFEGFITKLDGWDTQGLSYSYNDDIRRLFVKFEINEDDIIISLHFSLQYHVLLYYKTEQKVMDLQKELADIITKTNISDSKYSGEGNKIILQKLKELGYEKINEHNLFELFYNDETLSKMLSDKIEKSQDNNIIEINKRKTQVLKELDDLLLEIFQTSNVLIDEQKLVNGEEGCLCNIDLEHIENGSKHGLFDLDLLESSLQKKIERRVDQISLLVDN